MKDIIKEQLRKILLEGSKKKILMDKLGLSEVNAEILDEICGSLAVWMANKLIGYQLYIVKSYRNFDDNIKTTDDVVDTSNGLKVIIDRKSLLYLAGTELSYSDGLNGKGFQWGNPNASRTCGCGESFSI
jgi:Fe-S cluster assembly iron-binding protein IscA